MKNVTLKRAFSYYRPYYYENKKIQQIIIFNSNMKFVVNQGWLEQDGKDVEELKFDELFIKRKVSLDYKYSFLAKDLNRYKEVVLTLFIYAPDLKVEETFMDYSCERFYFKSLTFKIDKSYTIKIFDRKELTDNGKKAECLGKFLLDNRVHVDTIKDYYLLDGLNQLLKKYNVAIRDKAGNLIFQS